MKNCLQHTLFVLNLSSGRKKSNSLLPKLKDLGIPYYISTSSSDFKSFITNEQNTQHLKNIVICGGDGTINSVLNHAHDLNITFAIYPEGSGNGLARELGYKKDLHKLIRSLEKNESWAVDLILINDQYCVNMSGIGFDGYVAHRFDKGVKRGFQSYIRETIVALKKYKPIEVQLYFEQHNVKGTYFMVNVANTRQFGNNAFITPGAQFNDGLLEIALVKKIPFLQLPFFLFRLFNKSLTNSKYVEFIQSKKVLLETSATHYHIDGEPYRYEQPLVISIPKQVKFIRPV